MENGNNSLEDKKKEPRNKSPEQCRIFRALATKNKEREKSSPVKKEDEVKLL